ncbi:DoxX family protein [Rhodococcus sp. NPDC003348]
MKLLAPVLSVLIAVVFAVLGSAKVAAVPPMRERAAHVGFGVDSYRRLGVVELTGAVGLLVGLAVPAVGLAASAGFVLLLAGALIAHARAGDGAKEMAPAIVVGAAALTCVVALVSVVAS